MKSAGVKAYSQVSVHTDVSQASPHRLIQLLIDAALGKISNAKGLMINSQIAEKGKQIGLAVSIIDGLRASLDKSNGGEIAENLDCLYDYMIRRLTDANITNDVAILDEVSSLLKPIKEAWELIPESIRSKHKSEILNAETESKAARG